MSDRFLYLFDPLCGWCYGASTGIAALAEAPGVTVEALPTGLFAGAGARLLDGAMRDQIIASDRRIAAATGAVFGHAYSDHVVGTGFRLDSCVATIALSAVAQSEPARALEALRIIQRARYVDGRDILELAVLTDVLRSAGFHTAAAMLGASDPALLATNAERLTRAQAIMRRFGLSGVPSLLRETEGGLTPIDASPLYRDALSLLSTSRAA